MPDELADDAQSGARGDGLDRGRDVLDVVARDGRRDPRQHRLAGQVDQLGDLGRRVADIEGPRPIAVPAVDDGAGVDRHDLAGTDRPLARDAVDDLVIDGDADAGRERPARVDPRVALERRGRTGGADVRLGDGVEMRGRDAGAQLGLDLSRTSATTRPARRIRSISARDLRVTISDRPRAAQGVHQRVGEGVDPAPAIDARQDAARAVVVDDLEERRDLLRHPGPDGGLLVVGALDELRAVEVAQAVDAGGFETRL